MTSQPARTPHTVSIADVFDRLDAWRHYPSYALERRADIFFSLYLREVIEQELDVDLADTIIPEFPLKHTDNNQSDKVDYMLCSKDRARVYLVELKTDLTSHRTPQAAYLERAKAAGVTVLLRDVCTIVSKTGAIYKYHHLLRGLSTLGLLVLPPELQAEALTAPKRQVRALLEQLSVKQLSECTVEIIYIQPRHNNEPNRIDFATFARHVGRHDDPISRRFVESLQRSQDPAGQRQVQQELAKVRV